MLQTYETRLLRKKYRLNNITLIYENNEARMSSSLFFDYSGAIFENIRNRQIKPREEQNEKAAKSGFSDVDIQYGISGSGELKRSVKYFNAFKPFFSAVIASE